MPNQEPFRDKPLKTRDMDKEMGKSSANTPGSVY